MQRSAEAIVVGAGVIGASIAFHLTRLGMRDVLILEQDMIAAHATGRSGALIRTHYTNEPEARLALAALPWFQEWAERVGGDCGFVQTGFLQFADPADREILRDNVAMLQRVGVDTRLVNAQDIADIQPQLHVKEFEVAAYEPLSGYADPVATTDALIVAAQRNGARLIEGAAVTRLNVEGGRITGVETNQGAFTAPIVALANGAWSVPLVRPLDIVLPIYPLWIEIGFFSRPSAFARGENGHLTIIDRANGFYLRPEEDDLTLVGLSAYNHPLDNASDYADQHDPHFVTMTRRQVSRRIPALQAEQYVRGHAGPLDVTIDSRAILDRAPGVDGLYLAVGMSGSGFKKAPAIGLCMAELIVNGAAITAPIRPFRLDRYVEGEPIVGNDYRLPRDAINPDATTAWQKHGLVH